MIALLLIPLCSILNHWAGQSTFIPFPRFVCRVFGITAAFCVVSALTLPFDTALAATGIVGLGMALWALPGWASGFSCVGDGEDGRQQTWLSGIVNDFMDVSYLDRLTLAQCKEWGCIYMTLRGLYLYPMFCALAGLLTPWALLIGLGSCFMGVIYGHSRTVERAEYIQGALIGTMLGLVLLSA